MIVMTKIGTEQMKTSSAKAKGRRLAAEVKELLIDHAPNVVLPPDIVVTSSGETGEDLKLSTVAKTVYPFVIECKNQEKLNIWASLDQAKSHQADTSETPVLFFRRNRSEIYVALRAADFLRLYRGR